MHLEHGYWTEFNVSTAPYLLCKCTAPPDMLKSMQGRCAITLPGYQSQLTAGVVLACEL